MPETMLDCAKRNLTTSKWILQYPNDSLLSDSAYMLQQSAEKALKYCYNQFGMKTIKTHDIRSLLEGLMQYSDVFPAQLMDALDLRADTLTLWEEKTRYPCNYLVTRRSLETIVVLIEQLIAFIEENIAPLKGPRGQGIQCMSFDE